MKKYILFILLSIMSNKAFADNSMGKGTCEDAVFSSSPSGSFSSEMQSEVHFTCNDMNMEDVPGRYPNVAITLLGVSSEIPTVWVYDWHGRKEDWALKYNRANHIKETENTFSIEYAVSAVINRIGGRSIPVGATGSSILKIDEIERKITNTVSVNYLGLDRQYHNLYYRFSINGISKEKIAKVMKNVRETQ